MGYLAGTTAGIYRYTQDGRRIYSFGILPRPRYVVHDEQAPVLEQRIRRYHVLGLGVLFVVTYVASRLQVSWPWPILIAGLMFIAIGSPLIVRGLKRTKITKADLVPRDRRAHALAQARALGEPTLVFMFLGGIGMAGVGAMVALAYGDWLGWILAALMVTNSAYMFRRLRLLHQESQRAEGGNA